MDRVEEDLRRASNELWGETLEFERFYNKLVQALGRRLPRTNVRWFKRTGQEVTEGFSLPELIAAKLYTGPLHSERRVAAAPGSADEGLRDAHAAVQNHFDLVLAYSSRVLAQNVFSFRRHLLRKAQAAGVAHAFPELATFEARVRAAKEARPVSGQR
jgi:hypothetical protein